MGNSVSKVGLKVGSKEGLKVNAWRQSINATRAIIVITRLA